MGKLTTFYRPPDHVNGTKQHAQAYLAELVDALIDMHPTMDEWDYIWRDFRRTWDRRYWPSFADMPNRLTALRVKTTAARKAAGHVDGARSDHRQRQIETRPYRDGEFMAAMAEALERSISVEPKEAALNEALVRMGQAMIERFDDDDKPRNPHRDNRVFVPGIGDGEKRQVDAEPNLGEWWKK